MDALIFMLIASGAGTLLFFVSGLYSTSTNNQIMTIYNYEYAGNALIALHYAKDSNGKWFWNELKNRAIMLDWDAQLNDYFATGGPGEPVWNTLVASSPAPKTSLCFKTTAFGGADEFCKDSSALGCSTVYSSSVKITAYTTVLFKLCY